MRPSPACASDFAALRSRELDDLVRENQRIRDSIHHDVALGKRDVADARIERYRRLFAFARPRTGARVRARAGAPSAS